jgi:hypothetical protein
VKDSTNKSRTVDQDELQSLDEQDSKWVEAWLLQTKKNEVSSYSTRKNLKIILERAETDKS